MEHLFDTCTILHKLECEDYIEQIGAFCKGREDEFSVSNEILNELRPSSWMPTEEFEKSKILYQYVRLFEMANTIKIIDINADDNVKRLYENIRKRYYGWMTNPRYCRNLIQKGLLTQSTYMSKGFRYKDAGECSLIAIALNSPQTSVIVSEDKGKVCSHPNINIFEIYRGRGLCIINFDEWCNRFRYKIG